MKKLKAILFLAVFSIVIAGCGKKDVSQEIVGDWVVVGNDIPLMLFSITEKDFTFFSVADQQTDTFGYEVAEDTDEEEQFRLTVFERGADYREGYREKLFTGRFKNNKTIELLKFSGISDEDLEETNFTMTRIKDFEKEKEPAIAAYEKALEAIAKEDEKERKAADKQAAKDAEKAEKERLAQEKEIAKEQNQREKDQVTRNETETEERQDPNTLQAIYRQKADAINDLMYKEYNAAYPDAHDIEYRFMGQYFDDWDDLLQEVWETLREEMPEDEFETLKAEQIEWIQEKEERYGDDPGSAGGRAEQYGQETDMTLTRVYELIEGYLE